MPHNDVVMEPHRDTCDGKLHAAALLYGQVPGWSCDCQWGSLTLREFRAMFGFRFRARAKFHGPGYAGVVGETYVGMWSTQPSGNAHQRRKARRGRRSDPTELPIVPTRSMDAS